MAEQLKDSGSAPNIMPMEIDLEHKERLRLSHKQGLEEPSYSDTLQVLLKKGLIRVKPVQ